MTKSASIVGFVNSVMFLGLAFGVDISDVQQAAVTGIVNAGLVLGAVLLDPKIPFGNVQL